MFYDQNFYHPSFLNTKTFICALEKNVHALLIHTIFVDKHNINKDPKGDLNPFIITYLTGILTSYSSKEQKHMERYISFSKRRNSIIF